MALMQDVAPRNPSLWIYLVFSLLCSVSYGLCASRSEAKNIIAIQLRSQGIPCTNPSKATKDTPDSRPDEMAWILICDEATYRVKLIPHLEANVDVIDPKVIVHEQIDEKETSK